MEIEIERYKIGDWVYFLLIKNETAFIAKGRVVSVYALDELNTKYIVSGDAFTKEVYDTKLFKDPKELVKDLCSCVIS